ncbi:MAG: porin family protein [Acidobacteriota bacterium]
MRKQFQMKRFITPIVALLFIFCTPALASLGEGDSEIGLDFGVMSFDSNTVDSSGTGFSLRGGYHFTDMFELEGQFNRTTAEDDLGILGDMDITATTLFVNGVFNFHPRPNIVPYVLVGLGSTGMEIEVLGVKVDDSSTALQGGFGSRFFFGAEKKIALRVELSFISEDTFGEDSTHTNFVGGLTWKLGS